MEKGTSAVMAALESQASQAETAAPATQPAPEDQAPADPPPEDLDGPQTGESNLTKTPKRELEGLGDLLGLPEDVVQDILATEKVSHRSATTGMPYTKARAAIEAAGKELRQRGKK